MAIRRVTLLPKQARGPQVMVLGQPLRADAALEFVNSLPTRPSARWSGRQADGKTVRPHIPNQITALRVETLASVGFSDEEIAVALDMRPGQVRQYYGKVADSAIAHTNFQVAFRAQQNALLGGSADVAFWLRHRAGWKDKTGLEHSGPDGQPIRGAVTFYLPQNGRLLSPPKGGNGSGG